MFPPTPSTPLFPYTTLFRSVRHVRGGGLHHGHVRRVGLHGVVHLLLGDRTAAGERRVAGDVELRSLLGRLGPGERSEEHTSELQSRGHLVCRLLLEKKKATL